MRRALFALLLALSATACSGGAGGAPAAPGAKAPAFVNGAEAKKLVEAGAVLLDVRTKDEFDEYHLPGARNLPVSDVRSQLASLPKDKPIVVYCAVGSRSKAAANMLAAAGYDARNLGAIGNWPK